MKIAHSSRSSGLVTHNSRWHRPPLHPFTPCTAGLRVLRPTLHFARVNASTSGSAGGSVARRDPFDSMNPDLDEVQLDDAYYEEIGMTREEAMRQQKEILYNIDPDSSLLDDVAKVDESLPEEWRKAIESLEVYGPKAVIMAGFRVEEYAVARATLDQLGADDVKILPVTEEMLQGPLDLALATPEVDWSAPRPPDWILGGAWGSQRCIMFSGLSLKAQATILEYLEAQGLPPVCVTMALKEDGQKRLGELMAAAVQAQRNMKAPKVAPWEVPRQAAAAPGSGSSSGNRAGSSSSSSGASGSSSSGSKSRRGIDVSSLPGKRGPLFSRPAAAAGGSSSRRLAEEGLEDLQSLITPEMAKQRLKVNPADLRNELTDFIDMELTDDSDNVTEPQQQQQQQQQQRSSSSATNAAATPSSSTSSSSTIPGGLDNDPQAMLDWFHDESTGKTVELPWTGDPPAAAAAAAAAAGFGADSSSTSAADLGLDISLDDLLPNTEGTVPDTTSPAAAAAAGPGSSSSSSGNLINNMLDPDESDSVSMFAAIQTALKSGVDPEELKKLIDAAAAASAAAKDPVDLLLNEDAAMQQKASQTANALKAMQRSSKKSNPSSSSGSRGVRSSAAAAAAKRDTEYGPEPPPIGSELGGSPKPGAFDSDPLLKLRPEIERAFQNNQIKFVDMNKMPKKYKQRYTQETLQERMRQQQQQYLQQQQQEEELEVQQQQQQEAGSSEKPGQQQQQQRWWQQQRSRQQQQFVQSLSGVGGKLPAGGKLVEADTAGDVIQQQQQQQWQQQPSAYSGQELEEDGDHVDTSAVDITGQNNTESNMDQEYEEMLYAEAELVGESEEDQQSLWFNEFQLQDLVETANSQGLDPTRALAQALAFGVQVQPEVAAAVGITMPDQDLIESCRKDIIGSIRELQAEQGLDFDGTVVLGEEGYQGLGAVPDPDQGQGSGEDGYESPAGFKRAEVAAVPVGAAERSSGQGRVWGSGISSAVSRAKARLAAKKQQQEP